LYDRYTPLAVLSTYTKGSLATWPLPTFYFLQYRRARRTGQFYHVSDVTEQASYINVSGMLTTPKHMYWSKYSGYFCKDCSEQVQFYCSL